MVQEGLMAPKEGGELEIMSASTRTAAPPAPAKKKRERG